MGSKTALEKIAQDVTGVEMRLDDPARRARMRLVIGVDACDRGDGFLSSAIGEKAVVGRQEVAESRILNHGRTSTREVCSRPVTEPATARAHISVLGHTEFGARCSEVLLIGPRVAGD